jgi:hypothetical protein
MPELEKNFQVSFELPGSVIADRPIGIQIRASRGVYKPRRGSARLG